MKNNQIRGRAYGSRIVRSLKKLGESALAEESASVRKALTLVAGLPSPVKEQIFVRLIVDELNAEQFASSVKQAANA